MMRRTVLVIAIAAMGTACLGQSKSVENEPTFQSIKDNTDELVAKYPRVKNGEASSCTEMKLASYVKLHDKQHAVRDLASSGPKLRVKEWVYFEGTTGGFDGRSELFDVSNAKGTIEVGNSSYEAVLLIVPDTQIFVRIGKGELLLDDSPYSFASKEGVKACGYGLVVEREGRNIIAIADVIRDSGSAKTIKELASEPERTQAARQNSDGEVGVGVDEDQEVLPALDSSRDTRLQSSVKISPSFMCKDNALPSEAAICNSHSLARLDRELETAYRDALNVVGSQGNVKRSYLVSMQRQWLAERNKQCEADAVCLEEYMRSRIAELKAN